MTEKKNSGMVEKTQPDREPESNPAEQGKDGYEKLDNQYEAAGFTISMIFRNWKKFLAIVLAILFIIGLILLALLPGYKCQTETGSFEKTPVNLPGKKHQPVPEGYQYIPEGMNYGH